MSKADTPVNLRIFQAVGEDVAYIPKASDKDIAKGMDHARAIAIPGRLAVMHVTYLNGWTMAM